MTFKVGAKVQRVFGHRDASYDHYFEVDAVYTVKAIEFGGLLLEEVKGPGSFSPKLFTAYTPKVTGMILAEDPTERKNTPITSGVLDYFPRALAAVAQCSKAGNDQHNPGQPLHWEKSKSTDHADCIARHLIDREAVDTDGIAHAAKLAWRALAYLETKLEKEANAVK
jgi:hypothetical protein